MNYNEVLEKVGKLGNEEARRWCVYQDKQITNMVDKTKTLEEQAQQAFDLRNTYRTQSRELMLDTESKVLLDKQSLNMKFDKILKYKEATYGLSKNEAYESIIQSATKTNKIVNKKFQVEDQQYV